MNIGSTHAISGKFEVEAMSTVVLQVAPITAKCMDDVDKNIEQLLEWMDKASMGFPGYDLVITPEFALQGIGPYSLNVLLELDGPEIKRLCDKCLKLQVWGIFNAIIRESEGKKIAIFHLWLIIKVK